MHISKAQSLFLKINVTACLPAWGGQPTYPATGSKPWGKSVTDNLLRSGINYAISFGGANGEDISAYCDTQGETAWLRVICPTERPS